MTTVCRPMHLRLLFLTSISLSLFTCTSQIDLLPSATQSGRNTFGCLIDGKSYTPNGGKGFMPAKPIYGGFTVTYNPIGGRLGIYIYTYAKDGQRIELYLNDYKIGKHLLNTDTQVMPASISPNDYGLYENEKDAFVTSSAYTGWINLTKADTLTGIVSGTFEFKGATRDGRTVTVSNGRFDVNNRTQ